jgi:hypothetical protein
MANNENIYLIVTTQGQTIASADREKAFGYAWNSDANAVLIFNTSSLADANRLANASIYAMEAIGCAAFRDGAKPKFLIDLITRLDEGTQRKDLINSWNHKA